jgi:hypothetical protein
MRGHKSNTCESWYFVEFVEELMEEHVPLRLVFSVAIDVLAKEGDLFITIGYEFTTLLFDALWGS